MKIPVPDILEGVTLREPCGDIYLSRIMEHAGWFALLRLFIVVGFAALWFKLLGYNVKLHTFFRGDNDRELHDHPWPFWSLVIMGGYWEELPCDEWHPAMDFLREEKAPFLPVQSAQGHQFAWRAVGDLDYRPAHWRHRVVLPNENGLSNGRPIPCVTLVCTRPKVREWGFYTIGGWVPWFRFVQEREAEAEC